MDCCDGSDEYDGKVKCSNTCSQAGKVLKEKLERKIATFQAGLDVRKRDVEHAKRTVAKEKAELSALKQEEKKLKDQVQKLKAKKEAIEKAEQEEKVQQEKEEQTRKQAQVQDDSEGEEKIEAVIEDSTSDDATAGNAEEKTAESDSKESPSLKENEHESLSKEELGRLVASRWTGENPNVDEEGEEKADDESNLEDQSTFYDDAEHEHDDEASAEDEDDEDDEKDVVDGHNEADEDADTFISTGDELTNEGPWWEKLKQKLKDFSKNIISPFKSPVDKSEADAVRKDFKESNTRLNEIQSKVSELEKKLEQDFGKDGEFYSFYGQCHELRIKKYTYKVCPFRNAVQVEGHSTTTLGNWDGFKDDYKSMHFVRGDRCWNGPDRSLKVKLRCGAKIELRDVDEPSRCEYVAELSTPAICLEERLKVLEQRLHSQGDGPHDEL
ncbi:hypothetical protein L7F22_020085 [Adiantum nelumboides]|nr:hypothetical protein [Adiantum nelumboides]